ncbi:hypothetical protein LTR36_001285 [Oleoguttula mirabilis]|uniref:Uncharacterized protein n=1 Tax=Oleoguttula mirabilis TaxID=1507867 RepID=A0AAV9JR99_9PEZI|nr:hypothetical protein LTR36_001285 [Oleoguttula mirabilis]
MSTERNSSAVRNLRSIFENKGGDHSPDTRGRSRSGLTSDKENSRPTSRIRANFVSVERSGGMAAATENGVGDGMAELKRESSAGMRRGSFMATEESDEGGLLELKYTVSAEAVRREQESNVAEAIPEAAVESAAVTPTVQASEDYEDEDEAVDESPLAHKEDKEAPNPDKPTTAAEEEPGIMKPAQPANEGAVSGGDALPPITEDLRSNGHAEKAENAEPSPKTNGESTHSSATKSLESALKTAKKPAAKPATKGKPSSITTKAPAKPFSSTGKSPASQPKTPLSAKAPSSTKTESPKLPSTKEPTRKASRSSLTAPTAASVARAAGTDRSVSTASKLSPNSKAKPKESTKSTDLPSRLTAPTAASRAKHEPATAPPTTNGTVFNGRSSTTTRPKPQTARPQTSSARPTPRPSLTHGPRSESRASQAGRKPAAPPDGSFLERMMRPTAASSSKTHEKTEAKSPPRTRKTTAPPKPTMNGHVKKPAAPMTHSRPGIAKSAGTEKAALEHQVDEPPAEQADGDPVKDLVEAARDAGKGVHVEPPADLPVTHGGTAEDDDGNKGEPAGNETPIPQTNGHHETDEALEATPAAIGGEETIR